MIKQYLATALVVTLLGACKEKSDNAGGGDMVKADSREITAEVDTVTVTVRPFQSDIVSNGRVKAVDIADIYFRSSELISDVMVHNGQRVKKGQVLAQLDTFRFETEKSLEAVALAKARLELKDALIGQGYNPDDMATVPAEVMELVRVRSGFEQAEASYAQAMRDIQNARLTAPFDGVVANVNGARHTMAMTSVPFCRVINDNNMSVEFPILENELANIHLGETVEVSPYSSDEKYHGRVTEINPMVDEHGHIAVKAVIDGGGHGLVDGANVRIRSSHSLGNRLVVPKSAVVQRTGRYVVFTLKNGKAMWNYVSIGLENLDSYEITEGLSEGDVVIFSGNENLAHETPVTILQSNKR